MPSFIDYLLENIDSESPGEITVAPGDCKGVMYFTVDSDKVFDCVKEILGYSEYDDRAWAAPEICYGALRRTIPMSMPGGWTDPLYAEKVDVMYFNPDGAAMTINNEILVNQFSTSDPAKAVSVKTFPYYGIYQKAKLAVYFSARNYFVLSDAQLDAVAFDGANPKFKYTYYNKRQELELKDGKRFMVPYSDPVNWYDFCEYLRFTEVMIEPNNDVIVLENGQLYWKTRELTDADKLTSTTFPILDSALGAMNASAVFQNITKNLITMTWYDIPYSITTNPQYAKYAGTVNYGPNYDQDPDNIDKWGYPLYKFKPGSLLFLGAEFMNRRSPFPVFPFMNDSKVNAVASMIENQWVDIKFTFLQFDVIPELVIPPNPFIMDTSVLGKMYTTGFNFAPMPYGGFHYMESQPYQLKSLGLPPYWSYDHRRLYCPQATE